MKADGLGIGRGPLGRHFAQSDLNVPGENLYDGGNVLRGEFLERDGTMHDMTAGNLRSAFGGESIAHMRYTAEGDAPDTCPVCSARKAAFLAFV